jgi:putative ABC transport system ATP-binding protein
MAEQHFVIRAKDDKEKDFADTVSFHDAFGVSHEAVLIDSKRQQAEPSEPSKTSSIKLDIPSPTSEQKEVKVEDKLEKARKKAELERHETWSREEDIVVVSNVHKTYLLGVEGVPALRGVSLRIRKGEFVVILGKSGGGKTSLLNIIGTIDKPTKGELSICKKRITAKTTDEEFATLRLRKIGFVFQTFNLISTMSAIENVSLPMVLDGRRSRDEIKKRAMELLNRVGISARATHLPSQLSGGEQQRVTIARAVANNPEILLLDEPTGDLDTKNSHIILKLLLDLNRKENITCVMVTHDQALKNYAHRVVHMMDGKIYRIEKISDKTRQEMDEALIKRTHELLQEAQTMKMGAPTAEVRDPSFYKFVSKGAEKKSAVKA